MEFDKPKSRRWSEVPQIERVSGYWLAVPDDDATELTGDGEIVFLSFDGKWHVLRMGMAGAESPDKFSWIGLVR